MPPKRPNNPRRAARRDCGGVALILALVFTALLSVLVVGFIYEMEVSASLSANQGADFQAYLAAKSAVANGISLLANDLVDGEMNGEPPYDSMLDTAQWAVGLPFEPINDAMMRTSIADEYGKINLNALIIMKNGQVQRNEQLIRALKDFFALRNKEGEDPVDAIIDWLDYDDMDAEEPDGAENSYYMGLENPFPCKNGPMDSIEELLLIKHMTQEMYFGDPEQKQLPLSEYLTVHGDYQGRINVNTAPEEVIACVIGGYNGNQDMGLAQQIYDEARRQPYEDVSRLAPLIAAPPGTANTTTGKPGTTPQVPVTPKSPFKALQNTGTGVGAVTGSNNNPANARQKERQQQLNSAQQMFRVNSNVFRIQGDGMLEDVLVRIEAYVWRTPRDPSELEAFANNMGGSQGQDEGVVPQEPFRILDWKVLR